MKRLKDPKRLPTLANAVRDALLQQQREGLRRTKQDARNANKPIVSISKESKQ